MKKLRIEKKIKLKPIVSILMNNLRLKSYINFLEIKLKRCQSLGLLLMTNL